MPARSSPSTPSSGPSRVKLSRRKGYRMPPNTVKVDRATIFGNPFQSAGEFRAWIQVGNLRPAHIEERRALLMSKLPELRGKNLACWCAPFEHCHADVLLEVANG